MRTTVRLDPHLLRQAKELAARTGKTLTCVLEEALRESLARRSAGVPRKRPRLPSFRGKGLQPGVDLDNSSALRDLMEGLDAPPRR